MSEITQSEVSSPSIRVLTPGVTLITTILPFESDIPEFKYRLYLLVAVQLWASHSTTATNVFCKVKIKIVPIT